MRLILGSGSPRRLELLAQIGVVPDAIRPADINETPQKAELPRLYAARMAREKLAAVQAQPDELVLVADTVVAVGRRILGKPNDVAAAAQFLMLLSGRRHRVITGIALGLGDKIWVKQVETMVKFKRLSDSEISGYLRSDEWQGKAGAYAIQGIAAAFVPAINGSYSNIVGLPLHETASLLNGAGYLVSYDGVEQ
ncbi:MAG: nucleoside triphosphate pyrophosphatase [Paracoccaceae bacterium]